MGFYNIIIKFRFWLSLIAIFGAAILQITDLANFWPVFPLYMLGVIGLLSHIFIGPLRLVQEPMEAGNIEEVERILATIWFPNLLYTPVRSTYYTIKGNIAMAKQDFDTAEKHLKMSNDLGSAMPEAEGANKLQLGKQKHASLLLSKCWIRLKKLRNTFLVCLDKRKLVYFKNVRNFVQI
jgi:hypothetical protein